MECLFEESFGRRPEWHVRCPGRVNLIGEHIDYCGYGVLPMAIEQSTEVWISRNDSNELRIINADGMYKPLTLSLPSSWEGASPPQWFDYALCGWKGVLDRVEGEQTGLSLLVAGRVPPSAGLSSSSSLVCAVALAVHAVYQGGLDTIKREDLADLCAAAERFIGTQGGGMDQAAEILASAGSALRIDFNPLVARKITLPPTARFVVIHSGAELNKAAGSQFNQRVVECRISTLILGKALTLPGWQAMRRLREVHDKSGLSLSTLLPLVDTLLPHCASREEVVGLIGEDQLLAVLSDNTKHLTSFTLRPRARHVYSEAHRVDLFEKACEEGDLQELGSLMNASHRSCAVDYECSCPELDEAVQHAVSSGALGARLTGAGWGGCVVALLPEGVPQPERTLFLSTPAEGIQLRMC